MNENNSFDNHNTTSIIWLLILNIGYLFVLPFNNVLLTYVFRIPALALIVVLILRCYNFALQRYRASLFLLGFICILNSLRYIEDFSFSTVLSVFSLFALACLVIISPTITLTDRLKKWIYLLSVGAVLVLTFHCFAPYSHLSRTHEGRIYSAIYLTFGMGNSNFAGIVAFLAYSCVWITSSYENTKSKIITFLVAGWALYMIYETYCRSALAAALVIPLASFLLRNIKLNKWLLYAVCAIPFIFVPVYIYISEIASSGMGMEVMGKSVFSGRQFVYMSYIERLSDGVDYIFGTFIKGPFNNAHNGPLSIFVSVGILGCIVYYYIIINRLKLCNDEAEAFRSKAAIYVILAMFIESCGESSLFLGGMGSIVFFFIVYIYASANVQDDEDDEAEYIIESTNENCVNKSSY